MHNVTDTSPNTSIDSTVLDNEPSIRIRDLDFLYGENQVLHNVDLDIFPKEIMAFIGPSGCGKSTLLRCLNRMNDLVDGARIGNGTIEIQGIDLHDKSVDVIELRKKLGWYFKNLILSQNQSIKMLLMGCRFRVLNPSASLMKKLRSL